MENLLVCKKKMTVNLGKGFIYKITTWHSGAKNIEKVYGFSYLGNRPTVSGSSKPAITVRIY